MKIEIEISKEEKKFLLMDLQLIECSKSPFPITRKIIEQIKNKK